MRGYLGSPPGLATVVEPDFQLAWMTGSFACITLTVGFLGVGFD